MDERDERAFASGRRHGRAGCRGRWPLVACLILLWQWFVVEKAAAEDEVDVAIVLAVDASASVENAEYVLQLQGMAAALAHPAVHKAIMDGRRGAVAISVVTWSGLADQVVLVPWRRIDGPEAALHMAQAIARAPRVFKIGGTAIGAAIEFSFAMFDHLPYPAERRVVDVSADGRNNHPPLLRSLRERAAAAGIVVNGLPILDADPGLEGYFREIVITGPGAFVEPALGYEAFAVAFLRKLLREVVGQPLVSWAGELKADRPAR